MRKQASARVRNALIALPLLGLAAIAAMTGSARAQVAGTSAVPIPSAATTAPDYLGHPAKLHSIKRGWKAPRNPFMAPNGRSNLHVDAYQTDAYGRRGPSGTNLAITSTFFTRNCGSVTFDAEGRIVTVCIGLDGPVLVMLDPSSLATIATYTLPPRQDTTGDPFKNVSGGGYFYLDQHDQVVVPTTTRHVFVIRESGPMGFAQVADYDLTSVIPTGVGIESAIPDWKGRIWFAGEDGVVGWIDPRNGSIHSRRLGEPIGNSFAVDQAGGVYIVTTKALYRFDAVKGRVKTAWRREYPNVGFEQPGQLSAGSGTTPTLIGKSTVAITDNANRMHVIVYERGRKSKGRVVCRRGVFAAGASDTENSLVAFGNSLIVEDNYGYSFQTMEAGQLTAPGISRVDVKGGKCRTAWTSQERAPSGVPKVSLGSGLLYAYTRPPTSDGSQAWYFTALSLKNGKTVYKKLTGAGTYFNDHYAPISIGPTGVAYSGTIGGLVRIADGG